MSFLVRFILICSITVGDGIAARCIEREQRALLEFRNGFVDDYGVISSWGRTSQDCCLWRGVGCSNTTNHVVMLDLHGYSSDDLFENVGFKGEIGPSLLELRHLKHLDLSLNSFTRIPNFIGSLENLEYLNLSFIGFLASGFPPQLGNLSKLQTLDLSSYYNRLKHTEWLYKLSSLEFLSLDSIDLSGSNNLLQKLVTRLPSLLVLKLHDCRLNKMSGSATHSLSPSTNFSKSLSILDISSNNLPSSSIYPWLFNFTKSLTDIHLSWNELVGTIPDAFGAFKSLENLNMANNGLQGGIPASFGNISNLRTLYLSWNDLNEDLHGYFHNLSGQAKKSSIQVLDLSWNDISGPLIDFTSFTSLRELHLEYNNLNGSFPQKLNHISNLYILGLTSNRITGSLPHLSALSSLRELYIENNYMTGTLAEKITPLSELKFLGVSSNLFHGTITQTHLTNLSRLLYLDLSYNSLVLKLTTDWFPTFSLDVMLLSSCKMGPSFPTWIRTQKNLSIIDISDAQINDSVPLWFWELLNPSLRYLNLSSNQIHGTVPDFNHANYPNIDLSSNNFSGLLPLFPSNTRTLLLYNNMFSGSISVFCNLTSVMLLDVSSNQLSGELPDCWMNLKELRFLNLENNNLFGRIPVSMGTLSSIDSLSIRSNILTDKLPSFFKNFTSLTLLDVGENHLSGLVPSWIGKSLLQLRVLSLPSNNFHGIMPRSICRLSELQILDISVNNISGTIPRCLGNMKGMAERKTQESSITNYGVGVAGDRLNLDQIRFMFKAFLQWKGRKSEYSKTLGLVTSIDLSSNAFKGEIPSEITNLLGLVALNLSRNNLTWKIPQGIGKLRWLDFLDVSRNHLVGDIPTSLSQLSNLGMLDLSRNNLSGRIPTSTQLQSFDASSYAGNPALCGLPLPNACQGDRNDPQTTVETHDNDIEDKLINREFFISVLIGLATGFWGVCGTLVVKDSWRYAYFKFLSQVKDSIYVVIALNYARFKTHCVDMSKRLF